MDSRAILRMDVGICIRIVLGPWLNTPHAGSRSFCLTSNNDRSSSEPWWMFVAAPYSAVISLPQEEHFSHNKEETLAHIFWRLKLVDLRVRYLNWKMR